MCTMNNATTVAEVFSRINHDVRDRSLLVGEGMEEGEFAEARGISVVWRDVLRLDQVEMGSCARVCLLASRLPCCPSKKLWTKVMQKSATHVYIHTIRSQVLRFFVSPKASP